MKKTSFNVLTAALTAGLLAGSAHAAVTGSLTSGDNTASSTDLLQSAAFSSITGVSNPNDTPDPDGANVLRDGIALTNAGYSDGSAYNQDSIRVRSDTNPKTSITFNFNTLINISSIDLFHGHSDSGRDNFQFNVEVSSNGGGSWSTIYDQDSQLPGATSPWYHKTSVFDDGAADIATAVNSVRINFEAVDAGFGSLSEVDINGVVPEPSSLALLGLGGLAMMRRRRG